MDRVLLGIGLVVVGILVEVLAFYVKRRQIATPGTFRLIFTSGFMILWAGGMIIT